MRTLVLSVLFLFGGVATAANPPPGFRYPVEADRTGDWKTYSERLPTPYRAAADFNADGMTDEAWILLGATGKGWGLFLFLGQQEGPAKGIKLDGGDGQAQSFGVSVVEPGEYPTACGKGYWDCAEDEPAKLVLSIPALDFFYFESANSFFWWDSKAEQFKRTWMSD